MTSENHVEVVALGSAIVDVFCAVPEDFVQEVGIVKGSMQLVAPDLCDVVIERYSPEQLTGGGSAANTLVGLAQLGHEVALVARTDLDALGEQYLSDLTSVGVSLYRPQVGHDLGTGRCLVMVTPDGERTMATWLGAASHLEIDENALRLIEEAKILYVEGYLYDLESTKKQIHLAVDRALRSSTKVALSLSDPFCVERHRGEFLDLLEGPVSIIFANLSEAALLTGFDHVEESLDFFRQRKIEGAITLGADGALVFDSTQEFLIPIEGTGAAVDTTGAGDLFAAGFLHGLLSLHPSQVELCGRYGAICAGEVVSHFGARPQRDLRQLLKRAE